MLRSLCDPGCVRLSTLGRFIWSSKWPRIFYLCVFVPNVFVVWILLNTEGSVFEGEGWAWPRNNLWPHWVCFVFCRLRHIHGYSSLSGVWVIFLGLSLFWLLCRYQSPPCFYPIVSSWRLCCRAWGLSQKGYAQFRYSSNTEASIACSTRTTMRERRSTVSILLRRCSSSPLALIAYFHREWRKYISQSLLLRTPSCAIFL